MRITDVTVELVDLPGQPPFRWRAGLPGSEGPVVGGVLRVQTDDGLVGEAHTRRGLIVADLVERRIREDLLGRDPLWRELLWHRLWELDRIEELPIYALGLVDVALWDLAGKAANLPVHQLLGTYRDAIPAYASTVTFSTVEEYLDVADQCLDLGYRAIKLHAWGDARADAELCQKLRAHVGDAVPLMYDGSAGFDFADALYLGQALSEAGYTWYEEPIREFSVTAYRWLAERVSVPLLVAETSDGAHMNVADFVVAGTAGYVRTSAQYKGGITGAMRIAHLADSFQLRAEVHGTGVVNAHLCMAIPNTTYYESLVYTNPVIREPAIGPDGLLRAPTGPGIGYADFS
ncbi:enolase C-terminal domain-like protein [Nonomuraea sediminis]|uniref:enolase C-terminal domain-like protein n=1 Tax=Nonomuraea sediminis TaxID=2835864 RepID=UPI001BDD7D48|nr:enolase C-terminal domain-like protein [Nonomuraea sediminis]